MIIKTDPYVSGAEAYEERYGDVGGSLIGLGILGKDAALTLDGIGGRAWRQFKLGTRKAKEWRKRARKTIDNRPFGKKKEWNYRYRGGRVSGRN